MKNVECELRVINKPYQLGVQLDVPLEDLERFEQEHPYDVTRQRTEVIKYWQRNSPSATWDTLATAVERLGGHQSLVVRLRELHLAAQQIPSQENEPGRVQWHGKASAFSTCSYKVYLSVVEPLLLT